MRILGIIPARGGSKGIPYKNIKILQGKPLIAYTFESAQRSNLLTRTILSTDDDAILKTCEELGMDIPFKRPSELGCDDTPTLSVVLHALEYLGNEGEYYDAICLLQPTTPFRSPDLIDKSIELFIAKDCDSLISVRKIPSDYNPHWVFEKDKNGFLRISTGEKNIIPRRQELPDAFIRDGALYITKTKILINEKSMYGQKIAYYEHKSKYYVNIDTMEDWKIANAMSQKMKIKAKD